MGRAMKIEVELPDHLSLWLQSEELAAELASWFHIVDDDGEDTTPLDVPDDPAARITLLTEKAYQISRIRDDEIPF